ncbi:hypothetical protein FOXYSP1_11612 [Fusarium oxysporum f. sp. phaseoli]
MAPFVCIPIELSNFMLNCAVVDDPAQPKNWCIGPLAQPDYTRVSQYENDPQRHIDLLHLYKDSKQNSRVVDPGTGDVRQSRTGFYLQWHLPQVYRAVAEVAPDAHEVRKDVWTRGFRTLQQEKDGNVEWKTDGLHSGGHHDPVCLYRAVPNRWLVWRWIDIDSVQPIDARPFINTYEVFHIESNRCRNISDLGSDIDIEVDLSPFVQGDKDPEDQADTFLGCKYGPGGEERPSKRRQQQYVPLSVFNSSNPLFVDFQPHNGNVFSMIDTFSYQKKTDDGKVVATGFLTEATANYTVLGWVDDKRLDILADGTLSHGELLKKLKLKLPKAASEDKKMAQWLAEKSPSRAVCHGSIYEVKWTAQRAPTNKGHTLASLMQSRMPLAVGQSTLDSSRAFAKRLPDADPKENQFEDNADEPSQEEVAIVDDVIYEVQTFTQDPAEAAKSEIAQRDRALLQGFTRASPGVLWKLIDLDAGSRVIGPPSPAKPSLQPSDIQKLKLVKLRYLQAFRDACDWEIKQLRWDLFATWWKLKTSEQNMTRDRIKQTRTELTGGLIRELVDQEISQLQDVLEKMDLILDADQVKKTFPESQKTPDEPFFQRKDPTVTLNGFVSPWKSERTGSLKVRLSTQLTGHSVDEGGIPAFVSESGREEDFDEGIARAIDILDPKPDGMIYNAIRALIYEFCASRANQKTNTLELGNNTQPRSQSLTTLLKKQNGHKAATRKAFEALEADKDSKNPLVWNGTQFRPLFVEWEAVYFHLPFDKWSIQPSEADGYYWGLNEYIGKGHSSDIRAISGRELLRPQAGDEMLAVLGAMPGGTAEEREELTDTLDLPCLSFVLKGLSHHLSTRVYGGTHMMPSAKIYGVGPSTVQPALAGPAFTQREISLMGDSAHRETPYAGTVDLSIGNSKDGPGSGSPFKPVTHGQLVLTKLNIVDVFGQVISAVDINKSSDNELLERAINPYVSDAYSCSALVNPHGDETRIANTVVGDQENRSAFVQIPPSINQQVRLNASFVTRSPVMKSTGSVDEPFRPIYEQWENPVWGWVVVNYANHGVQFFLPDGKFYGQVLLGGQGGTDAPIKWQPFEEPPSVSSLANDNLDIRRLEELMDAFRGEPAYLQQFIHMIGASLIASPEADPSYSESQASLTGRCAALVDFGVSLQLAEKPRKNESTVNDKPPEPPLEEYQFPCLFGDDNYRYDGLIGYFGSSKLSSSNGIDFSTCYTYFNQPEEPASKCKTVAISVENAPRLKPYYVNPTPISAKAYHLAQGSLTPETLEKMSAEYTTATSRKLQIFSAVINPYSPLNIRTGGLLPTKTLKLATWTIKGALEKIDVFFSCGPILTTMNPLKPGSSGVPSNPNPANTHDDKPEAKVKVEIPTPSGASWTWMQPVLDGKSHMTKYQNFQTSLVSGLSENSVLRDNTKEPLVVIEGYLHLQRDKDRKT